MALRLKGTPALMVAPTYAGEVNDGASGVAFTVAWPAGAKHTLLLNRACVLTFTAPPGACADRLLLRLVQDAVGGRTVTWPATVKWQGAAAPVLTAAANSIDLIEFYWNGVNYFGIPHLHFA